MEIGYKCHKMNHPIFCVFTNQWSGFRNLEYIASSLDAARDFVEKEVNKIHFAKSDDPRTLQYMKDLEMNRYMIEAWNINETPKRDRRSQVS